MIEFFKKLFGAKSSSAPVIQDAPIEATVTKEAVQKAVKAAKKSTVKKATTRKPKTPKA